MKGRKLSNQPQPLIAGATSIAIIRDEAELALESPGAPGGLPDNGIAGGQIALMTEDALRNHAILVGRTNQDGGKRPVALRQEDGSGKPRVILHRAAKNLEISAAIAEFSW